MFVEQKNPCGANLLHMIFFVCVRSNIACHVEQNCSTWQETLFHIIFFAHNVFFFTSNLKIAPHDKYLWSKNCHVEKNCSTWQFFVCFFEQNFMIWSCCKIKIKCVLSYCDLRCFDVKSVLSWFTLFWQRIHFVAIYALLCGAKIDPKILSVEQKWQL